MMGSILHVPTVSDLATFGWMAVLVIPFDLAMSLHFRIPFRIFTKGTFVYWAVQLVHVCARGDIKPFVPVAYLLLILLLSKWPGDKWRKKLRSSVSSITEVAAAAFKRQQAEAFS